MKQEEYLTLRKQLMRDGMFRKDNRKAFLVALTEIVVFVVSCIGLYFSEPFSLSFWVLEAFLGLSLFRCFVLTHECGHGTFFSKRPLNTAFGTLFGCLCAVPYICWRNAHFEHHKWVGVVDKDPTSEGLLAIKDYGPTQRFFLNLLWKLRIPLAALGGVIAAFWLYPIKQALKGNSKNALHGTVSVMITALTLAATITLLGMDALVYMLPAFIFFYVFFECINLTHHSGLYPYISDTHPEPVPLYQQDKHCRTALMPRWLSGLTCYHFNLHTEHHLFPAVPWHNLPDIHEHLKAAQSGDFTNVEMLSFINEIRSLDPFEAFVDSVPSKTV